jgi:hypothetical protein
MSIFRCGDVLQPLQHHDVLHRVTRQRLHPLPVVDLKLVGRALESSAAAVQQQLTVAYAPELRRVTSIWLLTKLLYCYLYSLPAATPTLAASSPVSTWSPPAALRCLADNLRTRSCCSTQNGGFHVSNHHRHHLHNLHHHHHHTIIIITNNNNRTFPADNGPVFDCCLLQPPPPSAGDPLPPPIVVAVDNGGDAQGGLRIYRSVTNMRTLISSLCRCVNVSNATGVMLVAGRDLVTMRAAARHSRRGSCLAS